MRIKLRYYIILVLSIALALVVFRVASTISEAWQPAAKLLAIPAFPGILAVVILILDRPSRSRTIVFFLLCLTLIIAVLVWWLWFYYFFLEQNERKELYLFNLLLTPMLTITFIIMTWLMSKRDGSVESGG